jgi:hypothetical protein
MRVGIRYGAEDKGAEVADESWGMRVDCRADECLERVELMH